MAPISSILGASLDGSASKESACNAGDAGDVGLIPRLGRSPGGGNATHSTIIA